MKLLRSAQPVISDKSFFLSEDELPSHVNLRISSRARRLALRLDAQKRVFDLVVPQGMSMRHALNFVQDHEQWMEERLAELPSPIYFEDGVSIPVLGQDRVIEVIDTPMRPAIQLKEDRLLVRANDASTGPRIERFLKKRAQQELDILSREKAASIGQSVNKVTVRDPKTRWGSCTSEGSLSYSWRLILAPYEAMDYVVAHEVAHLVHMDHSKSFWALCIELSENYKAGHGWMKQHGQELRRYASAQY